MKNKKQYTEDEIFKLLVIQKENSEKNDKKEKSKKDRNK